MSDSSSSELEEEQKELSETFRETSRVGMLDSQWCGSPDRCLAYITMWKTRWTLMKSMSGKVKEIIKCGTFLGGLASGLHILHVEHDRDETS